MKKNNIKSKVLAGILSIIAVVTIGSIATAGASAAKVNNTVGGIRGLDLYQ